MAVNGSSQLEVSDRLVALNLRRPQALAQAIEEGISERKLESGTRLGTKADLREQFEVATTTVNEAIRVLEHRGVVQVKPGPGGGVFVAERSGWLALSQLVLGFTHSATAVAEVFAVRNSLEELIALDAASAPSKSEIAQLRRLLKRMSAHLHDPVAYLRSNWAFHRQVAGMSANTFARTLYEGLLDFAESELAGVEGRGDFDGTANLATHKELVEAIASGDTDRVVEAVKQHNAAARVVHSRGSEATPL